MRLGHPQDQMPVLPRAFGELSGSGLPERLLELFIAKRSAQRFHVSMSSDIHDLGNQSAPIAERAFRRLPPDVLASEGCQVHAVILHRPTG